MDYITTWMGNCLSAIFVIRVSDGFAATYQIRKRKLTLLTRWSGFNTCKQRQKTSINESRELQNRKEQTLVRGL